MADLIQLRSLSADRMTVHTIGPTGREHMHLMQTPSTFNSPSGPRTRSPKVLVIHADPCTVAKAALVNAPDSVKNQLADYIDLGLVEAYDITGAAALTGDQVRAL